MKFPLYRGSAALELARPGAGSAMVSKAGNFCALSFERHSYWNKETISFTKKLAFARATALGLDPAAEICRWYGIISCCLQRANAKVLRGEPVPGRHSAPPPGRFFSLGRDLALVGA